MLKTYQKLRGKFSLRCGYNRGMDTSGPEIGSLKDRKQCIDWFSSLSLSYSRLSWLYDWQEWPSDYQTPYAFRCWWLPLWTEGRSVTALHRCLFTEFAFFLVYLFLTIHRTPCCPIQCLNKSTPFPVAHRTEWIEILGLLKIGKKMPHRIECSSCGR